LLKRPGEIVSREELKGELWQSDTFVEFNDGLNTAIKKLRIALDDSSDTGSQ
jgi:DNA-binding winged helix-turn-helix (wHTH) protein